MSTRTLLTAALLAAVVSTSWAGDGHDHGDAPPAANSNGPKRLPDGSVFLPKPAQRQIGVRTLPIEAGKLPRAVELAGKVVMDTNACLLYTSSANGQDNGSKPPGCGWD